MCQCVGLSVCLCTVCGCPQMPEEGLRSLGTEVRGSGEPLMNPGPLQEQQMLSIPELFLRPLIISKTLHSCTVIPAL